jgi:hypothetical protein
MESLTRFIEGHLKLEINAEKSAVARLGSVVPRLHGEERTRVPTAYPSLTVDEIRQRTSELIINRVRKVTIRQIASGVVR